jgi:hypothetical protein
VPFHPLRRPTLNMITDGFFSPTFVDTVSARLSAELVGIRWYPSAPQNLCAPAGCAPEHRRVAKTTMTSD